MAALRDAPWLTGARARAYALILAVLLLAAAAAVLVARLHETGPAAATDFLPFYAAGKMVREGHAAGAYDLPALTAVESRYAALGQGRLPFMYPPVLLVLCGWLAALPQAAACALFEALGYIPLAWCLWRLLPRRRGALPLLAAPAFLMNAGSGQTGFFSAAAFAAAALLIARAPALAGACLGLLIYKPHLALLVPVLLLAVGQWRALFACAATAAALSAATLLALPVATWTGFLAQAHLARHVLEYSSTAALVISPFGALHAAGAGLAASYAVQALCALACLALAITAARRNPGAGGIALLAAASLVATPYAMDYDLAIAMVPAIWLLAEAQRHGWRAWEKLTLATLYVLPLFARATVILTGFQPAPLVLTALLVLVWRRAITQPQPCAPGPWPLAMAAAGGAAFSDPRAQDYPAWRLTLHAMRDIGAFLSRPRGNAIMFVVAVCAFLAAIDLLGWRAVLGNARFWDVPRGTIGHGWADMATAVSGYRYFQRGAWVWPLLAIPPLGIPDGTNVIFTDGVPILALLGRLIFDATGLPINLFGVWTAACLSGSAVALTLLVRLMGSRGIAAALAASVIGFDFPPLLFRWGHPALMAQMEITLALALYVWRRRSQPGVFPFCATIALCVVALLTNAYLFLMVVGLVGASILSDLLERPRTRLRAAGEVTALGVALGGMLFACGFLGGQGAGQPGASLRTIGYGVFSANLLGPLFPQRSGLVPSLAHLVVDGTGGQYEGFAYVGAGLLVLLGAMILHGEPTRRAVARHKVMAAALLGFAVLSLSDRVFLGPWHIATLPVPPLVRGVMEVVRSSGRFVWPPLLAAAALAVASAARRPYGAYMLAAAAMLQWVDTVPLRQAIAAVSSHPAPQPADFNALRQDVAGRDAAIVVPSFACLADPPGWSKAFTLELEAAASAEAVPTNTVYQSRHNADCAAESRATVWPSGENVLRAYLPEWTGFKTLAAAAIPGCAESNRVILCGGTRSVPPLPENSRWRPPKEEPWLEDTSRDERP